MTTTIKGEAGNVLVMSVSLGALLDGTTVTSAAFRVVAPSGGAVATWAATIEAQTTTSLTLAYTLPAALARGTWAIRPFLYTGSSVLVMHLLLMSREFQVVPDRVPPPA